MSQSPKATNGSFYIAAPYAAYDVAASRGRILRKECYYVTSRWHYSNKINWGSEPKKGFWRDEALRDLCDIYDADRLLLLADTCYTSITGGCHVELGYALGLNKEVIVIGTRGNIFQYLPKVQVYETWGNFMREVINHGI